LLRRDCQAAIALERHAQSRDDVHGNRVVNAHEDRDQGRQPALEAAWRADTDQPPHHQAKIETAGVHEDALQYICGAAQMRPAHAAGVVGVLALSCENETACRCKCGSASRGANSGQRAEDTHMTKSDISGISPFFIVKNVPAAMSFYRDRLGFDITFQGPGDDDIFFGIVQRGAAMIMLKDVGVDPVPNCTREIKKGIARWDAYLHVPDPDALAAEFSSRNVEFVQPLKDDDDGLRGFEIKDADGYMLFFGRPRS
jgi:uncharacterized glyoxalase superfamily protein PhnB